MSTINTERLVHCIECAMPMSSIHCHSVREKCHECGGKSKIAKMREDQRRERGLIPDWRKGGDLCAIKQNNFSH